MDPLEVPLLSLPRFSSRLPHPVQTGISGLVVDSSLLEEQHLDVSKSTRHICETINSHEKELFGLYFAVEMFDVIEDCQKHFFFWDFMGWTHFVFVCACMYISSEFREALQL